MSTVHLLTLRSLVRHFRCWGLSLRWFREAARAGHIPCLRAGHRLLFDPDAVERALLAHARQGVTIQAHRAAELACTADAKKEVE